MTVIYRVTHYPAVGKGFELRDMMAEGVRRAQANGVRVGLWNKVVWGDGLEILQNTFHDDMDAFQKSREAMRDSQEFRDVIAKTTPLRRREVRTQLSIVLVRAAQRPTQSNYFHMVTFSPSAAHESELGTLLVDTVRELHQQGMPSARLVRNLFVPEGGVSYTMVNSYDNLGEHEALLGNIPDAIRDVNPKLVSMLQKPYKRELWESVVPTN